MKKTFLFSMMLLVVVSTTAFAAEKTATIFPALRPGMSLEEVKAIYPNLAASKSVPAGATGYTLPDTAVAKGVRLLFVRDKLAMLSYDIKDKKLPEVLDAAKKAYAEKAVGDGVASLEVTLDGVSLRIAGDADDGNGSVTFVDPEAMKKIAQ